MTTGKILVVYKSVTGFTKEYAEMIAREVNGTLMNLKQVTAETMSGFDAVIFGGRIHAGTVDGLKAAKEFFQGSQASRFLVYATGAMPQDAKEKIEEMWLNNFSAAELAEIPRFYLPGGLRYDKMPLLDKMMMKAFGAMMKKKKNKTKEEEQFAKAITGSYDISSKEYIRPLLAALKSANGGI